MRYIFVDESRIIENLFELKLNQAISYLSEKINIWKFKLQDKQKSAPPPTP